MPKYINFESFVVNENNIHGFNIPTPIQDQLENYLMDGIYPDKFIEAILVGDLFRAVTFADSQSKPAIWLITKWVVNLAPHNAWGSKYHIEDWCREDNEMRAQFNEMVKQQVMWNKLTKDV